MTEKEFDEPGDDLEQFDELEKNFQKVVSDLVADQNLTTFRAEYEKLHQSLVKSHSENLVLIEKCRQLNNDILANANKVSSVMQLSQSDQRTIAGLKHEFEKAWSLVEISQDKEQKSKDVIESLKAEVAKLSRLVEQGSSLAFTQETSLNETEQAVKVLKSDIQNQGMQLEQMKKELEDRKQVTETILADTAKLKEEFNTLSTDSAEAKASEQEVAQKIEQIHKDLNDIKQQIKQSNQTITDNINLIKQKKDDNENLKNYFYSTKSALKVNQEDLDNLRSEIAVRKTLLDNNRTKNDKTQADLVSTKQAIESTKTKFEETNKELQGIAEETAQMQNMLNNEKGIFQDLINQKKQNHKRIAACQQEIILRTTDLNQIQNNNNIARRTIENVRSEHHKLIESNIEEVHETAFVENQNSILLNQAIDIKIDTHNLRGDVIQIQKDIEDYQIKTQAARSNLLQIHEEVTNRENQLSEKTIQLAGINENIKHQASITESIKNDRDLVHRLLQTAMSDNTELSEETKALNLGIQQLKTDIREKDELCLSTHITQKTLGESLIQLTKEKNELAQQVADIDSQNTELRNHIQKSRYLLSQTELQNMKQQQVINDLQSIKYSLNESVTKKSCEITDIHEKIYLLNGELKTGSLAFKNKIETIENLKKELIREVKRHQFLLDSVQHSKALFKEHIQLTKALLMEQGKCRALEDELERPMNIHRWRFLEGTNPDLLQLFKMSMELKNKLMEKLYALQRINLKRDKAKEDLDKQEKHYKWAYTGNINEEMNYLNNVLKAKNQQFNEISNQVALGQSSVDEQKGVVLNLREMLREEKSGYYDMKKKVDVIRASTVKGSRNAQSELSREPKSAEVRFVGGGFSVSQMPSQQPDVKPLTAKSGFSPHIFAPSRPKTVMKKKLPSGWNPQRAQLQPFLPTVSGPNV
ncbi:hypothetical protein TVAG_406680 [Trichomonas vaginalis G3]|uniref:Flagellar associated protein n=1 Tax=Trichomonas vaginalis (strain ATCC PRA-98 / G3) TaxID=412133 RepID=A2EXE2_TRIV3|nr:cilia- and flagella-associated protein 58-related family [Trichomonas vaginalis G3]EAY02691.1 hypothetical protein TVAG_406680 [Trichomonas vaginalis G3]KAI5507600.1 cilia- and flagella-associated protein 58-related family [Trichomonas vaginalis G3]|eukprot:XP_001314914.1 hypothetical protein [Trichomonas vaginalis G3]